MIVATEVRCTGELLDSVPVGGRIVIDYGFGVKRTYHKVPPDEFGGEWTSTSLGRLQCRSDTIESTYDDDLVTVHHPGLVRVTQAVDPVLGRHWGWSCQCGDGLAYLLSAAIAGDDARAHALNHAEMAGAR